MKQWSFQNRIFYLALLPGMLAALVLGSFFSIERSNSLDELLESRALTIAKYFAPSCEYGVTTGSLGILQNIANGILEEADMRAVSIYDQNMTVLAHAGPRFSNSSKATYELQSEQLFLLRTADTVRARAPIFAQHLSISDEISEDYYIKAEQSAELIGWVEVELAKANTRLLRYQYISAVFVVIALVLSLCGLIIMRLSNKIVIALQKLLSTVKSLENGQLDARVFLDNNGELTELATGINAMANALQRSQSEYQQNLDQATSDLRETLDEMEIRNSELQIGRREALEASTMKSEFLANVSHEIRTPLNGILGFSELLARTQLNNQQVEYLATIHKSSEDLLKILNDILDLSKIDANKLIIERINMNLRDILEEVIIMLAPEAHQKDLELNYLIYSDVPPRVIGDPLRLKQVLINLVSNAIKFTPQGSINIRISTINQTSQYCSIRFEVQDTGIGMDETQIAKVFTAFSQADTSTTRRFGGTGLGLVISKALVEAMGGELRVSSQLGTGSIFSFHIEAELQQGEDLEFPLLSGHQAALIDNSMMSRLNASGVLSHWGVEHDDFESPELLFEFQQRHQPNWQVILFAMDDQRPDNPVLQAHIRQLKELNLPIIASTSILNNEHISAYKELGIKYVLTHPCTRKNLYRLLRLSLGLPALEEHQDGITNNKVQPPIVLAVDDNPANLQLVVTLLKELNLPTLSATNGQEAIDIVKRQDVDLILMDIQMPQMNGLEATEAIRQLERNNNVPVIAVTAHAMADEKEALLKAGMNDYQTKPINQAQLINCIERWTGYRCQATPIPASFSKTETLKLHDGVFDAKLALHNSNQNAQLAIDLFNMLLDSLAQETQQIMDAWEQEQFASLLEQVHKLHGATRYCGVPKLTQALENLETALKEDDCSQQWPNLLRSFVEQSAALQHWASSHEWRLELTLE